MSALSSEGVSILLKQAGERLPENVVIDICNDSIAANSRLFFQHHGYRVSEQDLAACLRFLLHGIRYYDAQGREDYVDSYLSRRLIELMSITSPAARRVLNLHSGE
jgi:hypothetical protein